MREEDRILRESRRALAAQPPEFLRQRRQFGRLQTAHGR